MDEALLYPALLRRNLSSFIAKTFHTVDPATPYLSNWHIDAVAEYLTAASKGEIRRLIINMPPRALKSVCVSVAWPAWLLGHDPSRRIMAASYSQILSLKHSLDCRLVLESDWYKAIFPHLILAEGQNEKSKFVTTKRGFRFATSVGGTATGEGGNFLIVDDPHNPGQAASDTLRGNAIDWFQQTFMSRLNDKKRGVVVVVMQRLHPQDLTGHLIERMGNSWEQLCLPAIAEQRMMISLNGYQHIREADDILHPNREDRLLLEQARLELGSYGFAAQYQQQPVSLDNGMVKALWLRRYALAEGFSTIVQSWDTAIKTGEGRDFSVCTVWGIVEQGYYLLDVFREQLEYPDLKRTAISLAKEWNPHAILIEDKASGQMLLQDMRREGSFPVIPIHPLQDKVTRFAGVTPLFEAGRVYLPHHTAETAWLAEYEAELLGFPHARHDDQVDATGQFLHWARQRQSGARIRRV